MPDPPDHIRPSFLPPLSPLPHHITLKNFEKQPLAFQAAMVAAAAEESGEEKEEWEEEEEEKEAPKTPSPH